MSVEIIRFTPFEKGSLRGFVSVRLTKMGLEIHDLRLFEKGGALWVNMPDKEVKGENGSKKYLPIIKFLDTKVFQKLQAEIVEAIKPRLQQPHVVDIKESQQDKDILF